MQSSDLKPAHTCIYRPNAGKEKAFIHDKANLQDLAMHEC